MSSFVNFGKIICIVSIGFTIFPVHIAVKCFHDNPYLKNSTCEGDFCVAIRPGVFNSQGMSRTCLAGVKKPYFSCSLHYDDEMECYCDTDFCNTPRLFLSNYTILPIIECKEVHLRDYVAASCNNCIRTQSYLKFGDAVEPTEVFEDIQCARNGESSIFVFDPISSPKQMIARNFFSDACYNVSMHSEHFYVSCRCKQANCNSPEFPLPYPLSPPTVTCFTAGFDDDVNRKNYEKENVDSTVVYQKLMSNDSFSDEGG
ncbi:hypothetical protein CAEBREN_05305 [Caenorhabditis brenneri]|uniref:Uncharacterized protein n=1 Tax=Caenorhabditis brenneri TaxID=135651 RepID=G0N997_CAEBE|nr:hypothetical protein CAEBREN_05305 [Caenorhabditis brenneri]